MERGYSTIDHLWQLIDKQHISYLQVEESPRKLEEKKKLEALIREYLGIVSHEKKFNFSQTAKVLHKSVEEIEDFSAFRTTTAWAALADYAHNLIAQPWRKEFKEIKTYCGFYRHHVDSSLIGGEQILQLMGYQPRANGVMILTEPIDKKLVIAVSKDAFIALVECQIMRTIYGNMVKYGNDFTWLDVLQYRETHICSAEDATKDLIDRVSQQCYYRDLCMFSKYPMEAAACPGGYRYTHSHMPPVYSMYTHGSHPTYSPYVPETVIPHYAACSPTGYYAGSHYNYEAASSMKDHSCSVPTGNLIELDPSPCLNSNLHKRSVSDTKERSLRQNWFSENCSNPKMKDDRCEQVWRPTHSQNTVTKYYDNPESEPSDLIHSLYISDSHPKQSTSDQTYKSESYRNSRKKIKDYSTVDSTNSQLTLRDKEKSKKIKDSTASTYPGEDYWACLSCTFHNDLRFKICEMCNKSRVQGNEIQPLTSGGSECSNCTLVNEKGVTQCKACSRDLENSPTYI